MRLKAIKTVNDVIALAQRQFSVKLMSEKLDDIIAMKKKVLDTFAGLTF
jgi:hypothetical protein